MNIQCECGKFQAELTAFPKNTAGRLVCYCDDCQSYLQALNRGDLLDENGGTEIIPVYPSELVFRSGKEALACTRLSPKGMFRFSTSCCNTPIANSRPGTAWLGLHRRVFAGKDLEKILGPVRGRIMGRFARGTPPAGTPQTFNLQAFISVMPFMLKGKWLKKAWPSPFFIDDHRTSIVPPHVFSRDERQAALERTGLKR